jgi:hypothetical protein
LEESRFDLLSVASQFFCDSFHTADLQDLRNWPACIVDSPVDYDLPAWCQNKTLQKRSYRTVSPSHRMTARFVQQDPSHDPVLAGNGSAPPKTLTCAA